MAIKLGPDPEAQRLLELQLAQRRVTPPLAGIFAKRPGADAGSYPVVPQSYSQPRGPNFFDYPQGGGDTAAQEQLAKRPAEDFNQYTPDYLRRRKEFEIKKRDFIPDWLPSIFTQALRYGSNYNIKRIDEALYNKTAIPEDDITWSAPPGTDPTVSAALPYTDESPGAPLDFIPATHTGVGLFGPANRYDRDHNLRQMAARAAGTAALGSAIPSSLPFRPQPKPPAPVMRQVPIQMQPSPLGFSPGTVPIPNVVGPALTGRRHIAEKAAAAAAAYDPPTEIIDVDPQGDIDFYSEQLGEDVMGDLAARGDVRDFY